MVYWGLADTLAVATIVFNSLSILLAYTISRLTEGALKSWNLMIGAFGTLLIYSTTKLVFDVQTPDNVIGDTEASVLLIVGALLAVALYLQLRVFRRQLAAVNLDAPPS